MDTLRSAGAGLAKTALGSVLWTAEQATFLTKTAVTAAGAIATYVVAMDALCSVKGYNEMLTTANVCTNPSPLVVSAYDLWNNCQSTGKDVTCVELNEKNLKLIRSAETLLFPAVAVATGAAFVGLDRLEKGLHSWRQSLGGNDLSARAVKFSIVKD